MSATSPFARPDAPTEAEIRADLANIEAAIVSMEASLRIRRERESAGKRTDGMGDIYAANLKGRRGALARLEWLLAARLDYQRQVRADRGRAA